MTELPVFSMVKSLLLGEFFLIPSLERIVFALEIGVFERFIQKFI